MKRLFAIVLALLLATAVLSACGQSANEGATGQPSDAPSSETEASEETGGQTTDASSPGTNATGVRKPAPKLEKNSHNDLNVTAKQ
jgi:ABC-type glycerol-3-phosphate transport system substrate-binding protein